ncbi:MAG TPA: hypothetical protein HA286_04805 [Candidatus Poseidoniaceae archaeon]|nr:MAG TPA: hypothetical protein D7H96_04735 [Candidatus Poseidoniales archaeon]HIH53582.1 hypothetical protein [Candidatus Poseidoniaceae archaeon]
MVRKAVVNLARQRAAEALQKKGVSSEVIDRLPSIEDGFVTWISRSEMPMEAIDEMLRAQGGFVEISDLSNVVERTTGHAPPSWVLELLMTSMDADGDGLLSNTEVWTWASDRGLDVPPHLLAVDEPEPETPEEPPVEIEEPPAPEPEPEPVVETPRLEPVRTQPVPRPVTAVAATQASLEGLLDAFGQNLRGDEIQAIVDANTDVFHISGLVKGDKATLLGEAGWRNGRTLTVSTPLGDVDLQLPSEAGSIPKHVDHDAQLRGWNRGLSRAVFRLV